MGISTRRYFPARGTAGLERSFVRGKSLEPCPPPIITARTSPSWYLVGATFVIQIHITVQSTNFQVFFVLFYEK